MLISFQTRKFAYIARLRKLVEADCITCITYKIYADRNRVIVFCFIYVGMFSDNADRLVTSEMTIRRFCYIEHNKTIFIDFNLYMFVDAI